MVVPVVELKLMPSTSLPAFNVRAAEFQVGFVPPVAGMVPRAFVKDKPVMVASEAVAPCPISFCVPRSVSAPV